MIEQVDSFLMMHGFEANELQMIGHRGYLYIAIGIAGVIAAIMAVLSTYVWLT